MVRFALNGLELRRKQRQILIDIQVNTIREEGLLFLEKRGCFAVVVFHIHPQYLVSDNLKNILIHIPNEQKLVASICLNLYKLILSDFEFDFPDFLETDKIENTKN